jgi:surface antigen
LIANYDKHISNLDDLIAACYGIYASELNFIESFDPSEILRVISEDKSSTVSSTDENTSSKKDSSTQDDAQNIDGAKNSASKDSKSDQQNSKTKSADNKSTSTDTQEPSSKHASTTSRWCTSKRCMSAETAEQKAKKQLDEIEQHSKVVRALIPEIQKVINDNKNIAPRSQINDLEAALALFNNLLAKYKATTTDVSTQSAAAKKVKEAEIAEAIRKNNSIGAIGDGRNTYPKRGNCPQDNLGYSFYGGYVCQCVSYTGWKVYERYGIRISAWGNANQWHNTARNLGYRVDHSPEAGSVAISTSGPWGHAMWVEAVNGDGTINLSEYNNSYSSKSHRAGDFGYRTNVTTAGMWFIHF